MGTFAMRKVDSSIQVINSICIYDEVQSKWSNGPHIPQARLESGKATPAELLVCRPYPVHAQPDEIHFIDEFRKQFWY